MKEGHWHARLLTGAAAVLALAFAGAQFPGPFALLDNLSNFPAHFAAAFIVVAAFLAWLRQPARAIACVALAALALAPVVPWYFGGEAVPDEPARPWIRLVVSNVHHSNRGHVQLLELVEREDPDVIGLLEVNPRWLRRLKPLRARYPHHYEVPGELHVGLALYSRLPLEDVRELGLPGDGSTPAIAATLKTKGGDIGIVLAHPTSPVGADYIRQRNAQVAALAQHAAAARTPFVLAGDLNLTMWNDAYRPLIEVAGLHNARQGHGIGPTWPALGPVGVPIDHVLANRDAVLRNFRVLPGIGSDHYPVAAEFRSR